MKKQLNKQGISIDLLVVAKIWHQCKTPITGEIVWGIRNSVLKLFQVSKNSSYKALFKKKNSLILLSEVSNPICFAFGISWGLICEGTWDK